MVKAIIFDMDGLMIDSEPFHLKAYNSVLKKWGNYLNEEENLKYVGISDKDVCKDLVLTFNIPISESDLEKQKNIEYKKLLQNKVVPQPGLIELIYKLHKNNFYLAIASGSHIDEIRTVVSKLKIRQYFTELISSDMVLKGKPNPDIFLYTAKKLDVTVQECLVLEDAPNGVWAAKKADMHCYAIPSRETKNENFDMADKIIENLNLVFGHIEKDFPDSLLLKKK